MAKKPLKDESTLETTRKYTSNRVVFYSLYSLHNRFSSKDAKKFFDVLNKHFNGFQISLNGITFKYNQENLNIILRENKFHDDNHNHFSIMMNLPFYHQNNKKRVPEKIIIEEGLHLQIDNSLNPNLILNIAARVFSNTHYDYSDNEVGLPVEFEEAAKLNRVLFHNFLIDLDTSIDGKFIECGSDEYIAESIYRHGFLENCALIHE